MNNPTLCDARDCPCPQPFKDAAYCDDCPYRHLDAVVKDGMKVAVEPQEYGGVRFVR